MTRFGVCWGTSSTSIESIFFNDHWGEQARIASDNVLDLLMVCHDVEYGRSK